MSACTAPTNGHTDATAAASCPVHGARAAVGSRQPESISDVQVGDRVVLNDGTYGERFRLTQVTRRTPTTIAVQGSLATFRAKNGHEPGDRPHTARVLLPSAENLRKVHRSRSQRSLERARDLLAGALDRRKGAATGLGASQIDEAQDAQRAIGEGLVGTVLTLDDTFEPRKSRQSGAPYPYTDEDVISLSPTLTRLGVDAASDLDKSETPYLADAVRAFLPVRSRRALLGLISVVHAGEESGALAGRKHGDAVLDQLMRLQGYAD